MERNLHITLIKIIKLNLFHAYIILYYYLIIDKKLYKFCLCYCHTIQHPLLKKKIVITLSYPLQKYIKFWRRYVDDIFVVWSGTTKQIHLLTNHLNSIHKNLQFTSEIGNKIISFLDLKINIANQKLEYQIFRKPTFTDTIILILSNHSTNSKFSSFYSMFNKLID